jgi:hypothetical protein
MQRIEKNVRSDDESVRKASDAERHRMDAHAERGNDLTLILIFHRDGSSTAERDLGAG